MLELTIWRKSAQWKALQVYKENALMLASYLLKIQMSQITRKPVFRPGDYKRLARTLQF